MKQIARVLGAAWVVLAAGLVLSSAAQAEEWSKTFDITDKPDLRVETSDANIHVDSWDQKKIEVRVISQKWGFGQGGLNVTDHQTGDAVEIEVRFPHAIHFISVGGRRVDIEVRLPREGKVRLHTGDGEIRLRSFKGEIDVESGDGHEEFEAVDGTLRAHSGDGHIRAAGRFDSLQLKTSDGRIEVDALSGSQIGSGWQLHTGDGSVTLNIPENLAADLALRTGDGHITLDLPVTVQGRYDSNRVEGKLNGGGGELRVETGDGSIRIGKAQASL
jgi:DUF4097 and DUF4098 domain-containing protein YvlB